MSEIKVNKLTPRTNCGTTTLGDSGDTINIPAGVTISNNGTATGFGATGAVNWDVASIKTVDFTAVAGVGYFVDTATTGAVIVNLPAGTAGDVVGVADYAKNFAVANCTIAPNGTEKLGGTAVDSTLSVDGLAVTLVYVDASKGWIVTDSGNQSDVPGATYIAATGGDSIDTCGNFKTHIFTNPGTFTVSTLGNPAGGPNNVDYLVVAGGGGGASSLPAGAGMGVGGGGAGGFRLSNSLSLPAPTTSPLASCAGVPVSATAYTITVGGGATAASSGNTQGNNGNDSTALGITSTAGGGGGAHNPLGPGNPGGSGGGSGYNVPGGTGNTPPTTPPQGNDGGPLSSTGPMYSATGGGGAGGCGQTNPAPDIGGAGGVGSYIADAFTGPTPAPSYGSPGPVSNVRYFAGGGGGGGGIDCGSPPTTGGAGGSGGGAAGGNSGAGAPASEGGAGTINTGGGGGGAAGTPNPTGTGGSGIVMIRYRYR